MATIVGAGEEVSVSESFDESNFAQVLLAGPAIISHESNHISPRPTKLYVDDPYFVPNICQVAESTVSLRPSWHARACEKKDIPFKSITRKTCETVSSMSSNDEKRLTTTGISANKASANQIIH